MVFYFYRVREIVNISINYIEPYKAMFPKWSELQTDFETSCPESTGVDSTSNADFYEVDIPMHGCGATYQGIIS